MQATPQQNSRKLPVATPAALTNPPTTPSSAPSTSPGRRPLRCMNMDSGGTITRLPSTRSANGSVARLAHGESRRPTTEVSVIPMMEHDQYRACAMKSRRTDGLRKSMAKTQQG
jgi:hypothetical protein